MRSAQVSAACSPAIRCSECTLAQYVVASPGTIARRPADMDATLGAALSLAGASALQMVEAASLNEGDAVLVLGAAGCIGSIVLQLAAAAGTLPIAVTRTVNDEYVRRLGAAELVDYERQDVFETVGRGAFGTAILNPLAVHASRPPRRVIW